jgi:hypothetical protein
MRIIMKTVLLVLLISAVATSGTLISQNLKYGVKAGIDFANWGGEDIKDSNPDVNPGFHVGVFFDAPLQDALFLETGLYLATKGVRISDSFNGFEEKFRATSYYIDLPLLAKYVFPANVSIFAGPQVSYLLDTKSTWEFDGESETEWGTEGSSRFDIAIVGGIGYQFLNGLSISANYDFGLNSLDDEYDSKVFNRVIKLSLGYSFN